MDDEEVPTFDGQFERFVNLVDYPSTDGLMSLRKSDNWFHHANIFQRFKISLTDTGYTFCQYEKWGLTYEEYLEFIEKLCKAKDLDVEKVMEVLTLCGEPKEMVEPVKFRRLIEEELKRLQALEEEQQ